MPKLRFVTCGTASHPVAHEGCSGWSGRRYAHPDADQRGTSERKPIARHFEKSAPDLAKTHPRLDTVETKPLLRRQQQFTDPEQAHHCDQERDTLDKFRYFECQAQIAGDRVHTYGSKGEANHHGNERLERRLRAHGYETGESQKINSEIFRGGKPQGEIGDPT